MQYREDRVSGNKLSILGLGCMRFPANAKETEQIVLTAIEKGVNYFDTAYLYPKNEETLGTILEKHKKRPSVFIATKLPLIRCKGPDDFDKFFNRQLAHLKTAYIDYYLLHSITSSSQWEKFREWKVEKWLEEKRKEGKIRQIGFSYHGSGEEFIKVLDSYKWDFCQIQYNYYDENFQAGKRGLKAAAAKGIPVIIMEPLLGGRLAAGLPKEAVNIFARTNPALTPAAWALYWLWNQAEVSCVLSGMTSVAQMEENIKSAENFSNLREKELAVYDEVVGLFKRSYKINCTGCNYCMPCPKGIDIPGCFASYNTSYAQNFMTGFYKYISSIAGLTKKQNSPRNCINCGKCEDHCPQKLPIRKLLKKVSGRLGSLPLRFLLSIVRFFFTVGK